MTKIVTIENQHITDVVTRFSRLQTFLTKSDQEERRTPKKKNEVKKAKRKCSVFTYKFGNTRYFSYLCGRKI